MPTNEYYDSTGWPSHKGSFSASSFKSEFDAIEDGFLRFPHLEGNAGKIIMINPGGTVMESKPVTSLTDGIARATGKDVSGGYAGLTLFKINFRNVLNTFVSFFTNENTAVRTYTFQDKDGTIADLDDLSPKVNIASPTFTGSPVVPLATQGDSSTKIASTEFLNDFATMITGAGEAILNGVYTSPFGTKGEVVFDSGVTLRWGYSMTAPDFSVYPAIEISRAIIPLGVSNLYSLFIQPSSQWFDSFAVRLETAPTAESFTVVSDNIISTPFIWFAIVD